MHLNWVLVASKMLDVASKMQSLRHGFAKACGMASLNALRQGLRHD